MSLQEIKKWLVIEQDGLTIIYPDEDILPHGKKVGKIYDLYTLKCDCGPDVQMLENGFLVAHYSFDGREWDELSTPDICNL